MTVAGIVVAVYLATGAVIAAVMYVSLGQLIEDQDAGKLNAEDSARLRGVESRLGETPGGVPGALLCMLLFWPLVLISVVRK